MCSTEQKPRKKNNLTLHDSKVYYTSLFILNLPAATPLLLRSISLLSLCNCFPLQSTCITTILCAYFHHSLLSLCNCLLLQHTSIAQPYCAYFQHQADKLFFLITTHLLLSRAPLPSINHLSTPQILKASMASFVQQASGFESMFTCRSLISVWR
jgi:hypothetical protein